MNARPPRSEREVRIDLADAYRLTALNGWDDTVYTVGDGREWDGDIEWPALLRRADRLCPGFRD